MEFSVELIMGGGIKRIFSATLFAAYSAALLYGLTIPVEAAQRLNPDGARYLATGPRQIVVFGKTRADKYTKVGLFRGGSDKSPYKIVPINGDGTYQMVINLATETNPRQGYRLTDMRFFADENSNNTLDQGEVRSRCHFIMTDSHYGQVVLQPYKSSPRTIAGSRYHYDYLE